MTTLFYRYPTKEVSIGNIIIGNGHPIVTQTMTTTNTLDTKATVEQSIRCIRAGADMVRITAPSLKEAENLLLIKQQLRAQGFNTPLIADIHFTPNAAEIAARIVEKVRINPGNYVDKKKFATIHYTDQEYRQEIERIRMRVLPLLKVCKEYGTAIRIGTNHGSLSDRIMSRYGDTPIGMVESAMEFIRIARDENFHQIVLSMKSSNPQVMIEAYRLLMQTMIQEFKECYPLHLGVTEAGDGEEGRIKSAIGIGSLLEEGLGDTIRVSLTEEPEAEIVVCKQLIQLYGTPTKPLQSPTYTYHYTTAGYLRMPTKAIDGIGGSHVPIVIADFSMIPAITHNDLSLIGYHYNAITDKWTIADRAADAIFIGNQPCNISLPTTLLLIANYNNNNNHHHHHIYYLSDYADIDTKDNRKTIIYIDPHIHTPQEVAIQLQSYNTCILLLKIHAHIPLYITKKWIQDIREKDILFPIIFQLSHESNHIELARIHFSVHAGQLLLSGMGDGVFLNFIHSDTSKKEISFLLQTSFSILQGTRTRISKTEYISCPSCGRTLFDLQETTAKIKAVTQHLKGVKIAIMGCIVNGPGEMADADFGFVGSGVNKITLYKGKDIIKRNIDSEVALQALIQLLKDSQVWVEPM